MLHQIAHEGQTNAVRYDSNGVMVLTAGTDKMVKLWNATEGVLKKKFVGGTQSMMDCAFSADGRFVAGAGNDRCIRLWKVNKPERPTVRMRTYFATLDSSLLV